MSAGMVWPMPCRISAPRWAFLNERQGDPEMERSRKRTVSEQKQENQIGGRCWREASPGGKPRRGGENNGLHEEEERDEDDGEGSDGDNVVDNHRDHDQRGRRPNEQRNGIGHSTATTSSTEVVKTTTCTTKRARANKGTRRTRMRTKRTRTRTARRTWGQAMRWAREGNEEQTSDEETYPTSRRVCVRPPLQATAHPTVTWSCRILPRTRGARGRCARRATPRPNAGSGRRRQVPATCASSTGAARSARSMRSTHHTMPVPELTSVGASGTVSPLKHKRRTSGWVQSLPRYGIYARRASRSSTSKAYPWVATRGIDWPAHKAAAQGRAGTSSSEPGRKPSLRKFRRPTRSRHGLSREKKHEHKM